MLVQGYINIILFGIFFQFSYVKLTVYYIVLLVKSPYQYLVLKLLVMFVHINIYYYNNYYFVSPIPLRESSSFIHIRILQWMGLYRRNE